VTPVGAVDLVAFGGLLVALFCIVTARRRRIPRDARLLLIGIAAASLLHATSNVLEWTGVTPILDPFEDYFQIVEPLLWFFFAYSFIHFTETGELRESKERYRALYEDLPDAAFLADARTGSILSANRAAARLLGRPLRDLIGMHQSELHPPELADESRRIFAEQCERNIGGASPQSTTHVVLRSDGQRVPVEIRARLVSLSGRPALQGVFRDVSAYREAAALLEKEKEQAQMYLDVAGVAFVALTVDGRISLINPRGLKILGYDREDELLGRDWFEMCIPRESRDLVRAVFEQLMAGEIEPSEHNENAVVTRSGEQRMIAWHNTVLRDRQGSIIGTLSSGEDITDQRRAERERNDIEGQLRQVQKLESIGTLASGVAHEINNPLTGIINYAQLIHDRTDNEKERTYAQGIIDEGNRVARIVRNLLSFSRQEDELPSYADVKDLITSTLSLIGAILRKDQVRVITDISSDLPILKCRAHQIEQVLLNLLTNARDALNERYPEYDSDKVVRLTAAAEKREGDPWVVITVEDHGAGMPADVRERVFDPFFSTKPREKGTGLGLSVSYGLIREHGGRLLVESEPNAYTRVSMELPVDGPSTPSVQHPAAKER